MKCFDFHSSISKSFVFLFKKAQFQKELNTAIVALNFEFTVISVRFKVSGIL